MAAANLSVSALAENRKYIKVSLGARSVMAAVLVVPVLHGRDYEKPPKIPVAREESMELSILFVLGVIIKL